MALTVSQIDDAIDAIVLGAQSYTLPNGVSVTKVDLDKLRKLREDRKAQEDDTEGGIEPQYVEFSR